MTARPSEALADLTVGYALGGEADDLEFLGGELVDGARGAGAVGMVTGGIAGGAELAAGAGGPGGGAEGGLQPRRQARRAAEHRAQQLVQSRVSSDDRVPDPAGSARQAPNSATG